MRSKQIHAHEWLQAQQLFQTHTYACTFTCSHSCMRRHAPKLARAENRAKEEAWTG